MSVTYKQILDFLKDQVIATEGALPDVYRLHLADLNNVDSHTLDWDAKANLLQVCDGDVLLARIYVKNAKRAIAMLGNEFFVNRPMGIHHSAIVEEGAIIGQNCYIGPNVVICSCVELGDNVRINAGSVIGNEGFGFERDENGDLFRFPQIGKVVIANGVEIGSNVTIDRGALSNTVIGRNVKINNLVHIAHNVNIGANTVITAQVNISGSAVIGDNVWIGPGSKVRDHICIGEKSYVGMGSNVVKDIPVGEIWCGNPARKLRSDV